jgi:nitrous oxidase accessory protein NosD
MSVDISAIFGQKKKQAEADLAKAGRASSGRLWTVPDDFPDIQTAIDNANAGDGIFLLPSASPYILSDPLCISKPLHILGVDDVGESAVVTFQTSVNYLPLLRVTASNVRIKGLTLESTYIPTAASTTAGPARGASNSRHPVSSSSSSKIGSVVPQEPHASSSSSQSALPPLDPASPRFITVHISNGAQNVVFDECVVRCTGGMHGVFLSPDSYTTMVCCSITSTLGCALYSDARLYIDRCDFSSSALGLLVSQNSHVQVKASCFTNCDQGLMIDGHGFADVNVCAFSNCRVGMLSCADLPPPKVSLVRGCEFMDCTTTSLFVSGVEAALDVQKNFFHGTSTHGILLHDASQRVEIRANAFRGLSGIGVRVFAGAPIIECNVFEGCRRAGVLVESSRPTVRLNEFVRNRRNAAVNAAVAHPSPHHTRENFSVAVMVDGETVSRSLTSAVSRELQDEHYTNHSSLPPAVTSSGSQPSTPSGTQRRSAAAASAASAAVLSPSRGGARVVSSENANSTLALRGAIAASNRAAVNVMHSHPDPHVEGNLFAENDVNLWVTLGCGTYVKNELLSSFEQSVVVEGADSVLDRDVSATMTAPSTSRESNNHAIMEASWRTTQSNKAAAHDVATDRKALVDATFRLPEFPTSISHNELRGSVSSHVVHCLPGAFASLIQNQISHAAKGFGVLIESSRFVELKQNTLSECQGGIQARGEGATGKIITNDLGGLSLYVQSDATRTMLVGHNTNIPEDLAE